MPLQSGKRLAMIFELRAYIVHGFQGHIYTVHGGFT